MVPREPVQPRPPQPQRAVSSNSAKRSYLSYRSHSSSFEADDERSSSADNESMGEDDGYRDGPSQYAGEDTRLTSRKELAGWYTYAFAAEVFVICGIGWSCQLKYFPLKLWWTLSSSPLVCIMLHMHKESEKPPILYKSYTTQNLLPSPTLISLFPSRVPLSANVIFQDPSFPLLSNS